MLTHINLPQTDRFKDLSKATCRSPQRLLTIPPTASELGEHGMNPIASGPRPDLYDAYGFQLNAWPFLQASVPNARQKPGWTLTARAVTSRLLLLQGERDQPTILRTAQWTLKGGAS